MRRHIPVSVAYWIHVCQVGTPRLSVIPSPASACAHPMYQLALTLVKHALEENACAATEVAVMGIRLLHTATQKIQFASAPKIGMHVLLLGRHVKTVIVIVVLVKVVSITQQHHIAMSITVIVIALGKVRLVMLAARTA